LPVPLSPVTSTVLALSAITRTKSNTARIRALAPTTTLSVENPLGSASAPRQTTCSSSNSRISLAERHLDAM